MESLTRPALVTGANRGLGVALVFALLYRGAPEVYAAVRDLTTAPVDERAAPLLEAPREAIEREISVVGVYPDPICADTSIVWRADPRAFERRFAAL